MTQRSAIPFLFPVLITVLAPLPSAHPEPFRRGDANHDGLVDVSDSVSTLGFLFLGTPSSLPCDDATDANDDGVVDLSDAIATLAFLFLGTTTMPPPGAEFCGDDPTEDLLDCLSYERCDDTARVLGVSVTGSPGDFRFSVTIQSPDLGCSQYADWWEVISPESELLYRRILTHSHVNEQPFTRSGGPIAVGADTEVIVRAHMNTSGYSQQAQKGSPGDGFEPAELEPGLGSALAEEPPLPAGCAF